VDVVRAMGPRLIDSVEEEVDDVAGASSTGRPGMEAHIWPLWRCVPGPGMCVDAEPSGWPGRAMADESMVPFSAVNRVFVWLEGNMEILREARSGMDGRHVIRMVVSQTH